jgi:4-hydroxy-2-oxoglutarate aldolase
MLLEGLLLPLTTPFFPDGRLNVRKLRQNVIHYSLTPAAGMVVLGPNSEAHLLSDAEILEVLRNAIEAAAETKVMIAGVSQQSVHGALATIDAAAAMGYDAALVERPYSVSLTPAEVQIYFQAITEGSALPIVLSGELPVDLIAQLAAHPSVIGYAKDFVGSSELKCLLARTSNQTWAANVTQVFAAVTRRMLMAQAGEGLLSAASLSGGPALAVQASKPALKTRTKIVGFQVLAAGTEGMLSALRNGATGALVPFAAAAPQGCYEVYAAWKDGDMPLAEEKQERLVEAAALVESKLGLAGVKYGCDLNGYFGGVPRLPLLPLTGTQREQVEQVMHGLKS